MADFCKQCSIEHFNKDFHDLAGMGARTGEGPDKHWYALCEGCGMTVVNEDGECVLDTCHIHGKNGREAQAAKNHNKQKNTVMRDALEKARKNKNERANKNSGSRAKRR